MNHAPAARNRRATLVGLGAVAAALLFVLSLGGIAGAIAGNAAGVGGETSSTTEAGGVYSVYGVSARARAEIPPLYLHLYLAAARRYGLDWAILAGIGKVECDHGRAAAPSCTHEGVVNSAGAGGPAQFLASTWAAYGVSASGHGPPDRWNPADAIYSMANYLYASGAPEEYPQAIYTYNHAWWYVTEVEHWAALYRGPLIAGGSAGGFDEAAAPNGGESAPGHGGRAANVGYRSGAANADYHGGGRDDGRGGGGGGGGGGGEHRLDGEAGAGIAAQAETVTGLLPGFDARSTAAVELIPGERAFLAPGDGHLALIPRDVPAAVQAMLMAGNELQELPYGPAGHPDPLGALSEDCSSTLNYVLYSAGVRPLAEVVHDNPLAQDYVNWGLPGPGRWVTIYATASPTAHVFVVIAGLRLDTSHNGTDVGPNRDEGGPRWRVLDHIPTWAHWSIRHPPGL